MQTSQQRGCLTYQHMPLDEHVPVVRANAALPVMPGKFRTVSHFSLSHQYIPQLPNNANELQLFSPPRKQQQRANRVLHTLVETRDVARSALGFEICC